MVPSTSFLFLIGICLLNLRLAAASLYPTRPVKDTVYQCQQCDPITWKDDGKNRPAQDMGQLTVDLYCKTNYVLTVGQADPESGMLMFCPPRDFPWPKNCDQYLFVFTGTNQTVYTHNFRIYGTRSNSESVYELSVDSSTLSPARQGSSTLTVYPTSTSSVSVQQTYPTSSAATSQQRPQGYDTSSTTVYADSLPEGDPGYNRVHHNSAKTRRVDTEKLKFRFVFIVWPALIGITMAL